MTTGAIAAFGALLKLGDGSTSEAFATIAEVTDLNPPELMLQMEDATSHSSPNATREKIGTLKEVGDITLSLNFIPTDATHSYTAGLIKDWYNRTRRNFQLVFPDTGATTWSGAAYVSSVKLAAPVDGILKGDITLTPAGAWTLAG